MTFAFHPSVQALEFSAGTAEVYARTREPRDEGEAAPHSEAERETILFWRNDNAVFWFGDRLIAKVYACASGLLLKPGVAGEVR